MVDTRALTKEEKKKLAEQLGVGGAGVAPGDISSPISAVGGAGVVAGDPVDREIAGVIDAFTAGINSGAANVRAQNKNFRAAIATIRGDEIAAANFLAEGDAFEGESSRYIADLEQFDQFLEQPTMGGFMMQFANATGQFIPSLAASLTEAIVVGGAVTGATILSGGTATGPALAMYGGARFMGGQALKQVPQRLAGMGMRKDQVEDLINREYRKQLAKKNGQRSPTKIGQKPKGNAPMSEQEILDKILYPALQQQLKGRRFKQGAILGAFSQEQRIGTGIAFSDYADLGPVGVSEARAVDSILQGSAFGAVGVGAEATVAGTILKRLKQGRRRTVQSNLDNPFDFKRGSNSSFFKDLGTISITTGLSEGIAESLQEELSVQQKFRINENYTKANARVDRLNALFAGFFGGVGVGGGAGTVTGIANKVRSLSNRAVEFNALEEEYEARLGRRQRGKVYEERASALRAQFDFMFNSKTNKDSVYVDIDSQKNYEKIKNDLQEKYGNRNLFIVGTPSGAYFTTNAQKAESFANIMDADPFNTELRDEWLATEGLKYTRGRRQGDDVVVGIMDKETGELVHYQQTSSNKEGKGTGVENAIENNKRILGRETNERYMVDERQSLLEHLEYRQRGVATRETTGFDRQTQKPIRVAFQDRGRDDENLEDTGTDRAAVERDLDTELTAEENRQRLLEGRLTEQEAVGVNTYLQTQGYPDLTYQELVDFVDANKRILAEARLANMQKGKKVTQPEFAEVADVKPNKKTFDEARKKVLSKEENRQYVSTTGKFKASPKGVLTPDAATQYTQAQRDPIGQAAILLEDIAEAATQATPTQQDTATEQSVAGRAFTPEAMKMVPKTEILRTSVIPKPRRNQFKTKAEFDTALEAYNVESKDTKIKVRTGDAAVPKGGNGTAQNPFIDERTGKPFKIGRQDKQATQESRNAVKAQLQQKFVQEFEQDQRFYPQRLIDTWLRKTKELKDRTPEGATSPLFYKIVDMADVPDLARAGLAGLPLEEYRETKGVESRQAFRTQKGPTQGVAMDEVDTSIVPERSREYGIVEFGPEFEESMDILGAAPDTFRDIRQDVITLIQQAKDRHSNLETNSEVAQRNRFKVRMPDVSPNQRAGVVSIDVILEGFTQIAKTLGTRDFNELENQTQQRLKAFSDFIVYAQNNGIYVEYYPKEADMKKSFGAVVLTEGQGGRTFNTYLLEVDGKKTGTVVGQQDLEKAILEIFDDPNSGVLRVDTTNFSPAQLQKELGGAAIVNKIIDDKGNFTNVGLLLEEQISERKLSKDEIKEQKATKSKSRLKRQRESKAKERSGETFFNEVLGPSLINLGFGGFFQADGKIYSATTSTSGQQVKPSFAEMTFDELNNFIEHLKAFIGLEFAPANLKTTTVRDESTKIEETREKRPAGDGVGPPTTKTVKVGTPEVVGTTSVFRTNPEVAQFEPDFEQMDGDTVRAAFQTDRILKSRQTRGMGLLYTAETLRDAIQSQLNREKGTASAAAILNDPIGTYADNLAILQEARQMVNPDFRSDTGEFVGELDAGPEFVRGRASEDPVLRDATMRSTKEMVPDQWEKTDNPRIKYPDRLKDGTQPIAPIKKLKYGSQTVNKLFDLAREAEAVRTGTNRRNLPARLPQEAKRPYKKTIIDNILKSARALGVTTNITLLPAEENISGAVDYDGLNIEQSSFEFARAFLLASPSKNAITIKYKDRDVILMKTSDEISEGDYYDSLLKELGNSFVNQELEFTLKQSVQRKPLQAEYDKVIKDPNAPLSYTNDVDGFNNWLADQASIKMKEILGLPVGNEANFNNFKKMKAPAQAWFTRLVKSLIKLYNILTPDQRFRYQSNATAQTYIEDTMQGIKDGTRVHNRVPWQVKAKIENKIESVLGPQTFTDKQLSKALQQTRKIFTGKNMPKWLRQILLTADTRLRHFSPALADFFQLDPRTKSASGLAGLFTLKNARAQRYMTDIARILGVKDGWIYSRFTKEQTAILDEAAREKTPIDQLSPQARQIREYLSKLYDELDLGALGVAKREFQGNPLGFFPRVIAIAEIAGNPQKRAALRELLIEYNPNEPVQEIDNAIAELVAKGNGDIEFTAKEEIDIGVMQKRKKLFKQIPNEEFMDRGLTDETIVSLQKYMNKLALKVEFERKGGTTELDKLLAPLSAAEQKEARDIIDSMFGKIPPLQNGFLKAANNIGLVLNIVTLLGMTVIASLQDTAGPILRSRGTAGIKDVADVIRQMIKNPTEAAEIARDLGAIGTDAMSSYFIYAGEADFLGSTSKNVADWWFRVTGLEAYTRFTRVFAVGMAQKFLSNHAQKAKAKDPNSIKYLKELNITPEQVFAWEKGKADAATIQVVNDAVSQFVDESIVRPNPAQRPTYANDPRYALIWQLKSFFYAYGKTIVFPTLKETHRNFKEGKDAGVAIMPMVLMASMLIPITMLGWEIRERFKVGLAWLLPGISPSDPGVDYYRTDSMTPGQYWTEVLDRSGMLGPASLAMPIFLESHRYGKPFWVPPLGPTAERVYDGLTWDWRAADFTPIYSQLDTRALGR